MSTLNREPKKIAVMGLGYVGLPLALALAKKYQVVGFDIDRKRIQELEEGFDRTGEASASLVSLTTNLSFSYFLSSLHDCDTFIVTVPTPVDENKNPDFEPLRSVSKLIGEILSNRWVTDPVVIYESTVYPGATEEVCVPILERESGMRLNKSIFVGYSPERINPADKKHTLENTIKVTSGSNEETAEYVDQLYASIVTAGTYKAPSIKVAEACKIVENIQRDVNISLMNELALIFDRLKIDTNDVINAASTKWNFLPFRPGLVGGHCISVDPYYMIQKARHYDYEPDVIASGRRVNEEVAKHIAHKVISALMRNEETTHRVLILGLAFKENCPDFRNTKVFDLARELDLYGANVDIYDPVVDAELAQLEMEGEAHVLRKHPVLGFYDAIVIAVAHDVFITEGIEKLKGYGKKGAYVYDVKGVFPRTQVDGRL